MMEQQQPLDTDLEEMIKTSNVPIVTPTAINYSFQRNNSSSEEEEDEEKPTKDKKRARISKKRLEEEQQQQLDEEDNPPTGLKTLGALLVVLFIVAAIVAVIGYTTWSQGRQKQDPIRLWTEQHATFSAPLRMNDHESLPAMEHALGHYLLTSPRTFPCLCMHHLRRLPPVYQVCGVASSEGAAMLLLVNPHLRGRGNETDYYTERSVSCPDGETQRRQRYRTIILEWVDVGSATVQTTWARFEGPTAACLQLALDEMVLGDKHCRE
jgi:hypothetical protein